MRLQEVNTTRKPKRYGLSTHSTYRKARDFLDYDYLTRLSEKELDFLDKFSREFYQATFRRDGTDLYATDAQRKEVYGHNNARTRDMWNQFARSPLDLFEGGESTEDAELPDGKEKPK